MSTEQNDSDDLDEMLAEEISTYEDGTPPWDDLDPGVVPLVRAFSKMPGIKSVSSCATAKKPSGTSDGYSALPTPR